LSQKTSLERVLLVFYEPSDMTLFLKNQRFTAP
jgi:hypothetical protein